MSEPANVASWLLAAGAPEATAILHGKSEMTYSALRIAVAGIGQALVGAGCERQERVGIWAENSVFFATAYLGVVRAGMIAVPLQVESTADAMLSMVRDAGIRRVLVSRRYQVQARSLLAERDALVLGEEELSTHREEASSQSFELESDRELAALMFTSGSTGKPKAVMVSHRNIACNTRDIVDYLGLTLIDRAMLVLPLHYCFGLSVLHSHFAVGGSLVINNQFMYPESVLQEMQTKCCTGLAGVPSTYQILLRKSRFRELRFSNLRWLQQAGGKLPNSCIREIKEAFPNVRLFVMYGQTEGTARLSFLPPERLEDKLGSVGRGLRSTRLEVVRPDGSPVSPGSDEVGEIVASGENIAAGYWRDSEETARYFRGGRLYTGDLARVDSDGFIYIVEREREMIKSGGNRVGAKEVEDAIAELPEVVEVAVVGTPHPILGEAIVAFISVVPGGSLEVEGVLRHCRERLAHYKAPQAVCFMPGLPHNSNGKVVKAKLKDLAAAQFKSGDVAAA
jgi:long-chain acyl-CoA synthetase